MGPLATKLPRKRPADTFSEPRHYNNCSPLSKKSSFDTMSSMSFSDQVTQDGTNDRIAAEAAIKAQQADLATRGFDSDSAGFGSITFETSADYHAARSKFVQREKDLDFDSRCRQRATPLEKQVDAIIQKLRERDQILIYGREAPREGFAGQAHKRFAGDHFLSNVHLIERTALFDLALHMPKGSHLHIHFNACLPPSVLLDFAKDKDRMFITSDLPLMPDNNYANFDKCEIQFSIMKPEHEDAGNLFSPDYKPRQTMKYADFRAEFEDRFPSRDIDKWLVEKLVFNEDEAHGVLQTAGGSWEKFNGRTRMMKGLFNYEPAFRHYTRRFLEDLMRDNIQYAEIRPTFMKTNQLYSIDGSRRLDNREILEIIKEEVEKFKQDMAAQKRFFGGLKVIYTTPRILGPEIIKDSLDECLQLKLDYPEWIAGYDLAGEESKGRPLKDFVPQFIDFQKNCKAASGKEQRDFIPFLFHCGETLDMGTDVDGNLNDALGLGAKRIGHGFALTKHPHIMQKMKAQGICLELCPISNEILGLTPRVAGHSMFPLLANNVHCTVNSDNGALFCSTLSHDFYQVMMGKADFDLFGWKQLIMWSIEHACLDKSEKEIMFEKWQKLWEHFLNWVVTKYGAITTGNTCIVESPDTQG